MLGVQIFGSGGSITPNITLPPVPLVPLVAAPTLTTAGASYSSIYRADTFGRPENTLFQDVAGTVPVTAIGQSIACWKSSVGSFQMTQATSTKRPTLQQRPDGKYVVRFDGVDDELNGSLIGTGGSNSSMGSKHAWNSAPAGFEGVWHVGPLVADQEIALMNNGAGFNRVRIHTGNATFLLDSSNFTSPSTVQHRTDSGGTSNLKVASGLEQLQLGIVTTIGAGTQYLGRSPAGTFGACDLGCYYAIASFINDTDRNALKTWMDAIFTS
jgi:hypothetical protein